MIGDGVGDGAQQDRATPRSSLATSALFTYGTNMAVAALSLVNVLIMSRALGPSGRGDVVFLTAIAWLVSNLATLGVQEANANIAGTDPHLRRSLAANSVAFAGLFGTIAITVLAVLIALFPAIAGDSQPELRWLVFLCLPIIILGIYLRLLVQADYGFGITNAAWLITPLANVIVNGLFVLFGALTVGVAVCTWLAGQILQTVVLAVYIARSAQGFGSLDAELARRSAAFGARSHVGRVMLLGNYRLDQWLLGAMAGSRELGLYSVAVAWAEALWFLPTTLSAVQRPYLVRGDKTTAAESAATVFRLAAIITIVSAVAFVLAAPFLCITLFGSDFSGSVDDLRVLVIGSLGVVAMKQLGNALTAQRHPTATSVAVGAAFIATVILDVILIPRHGGLGAAIASSIAYSVGGIAVAVIFARTLHVGITRLVPRRKDLPQFARLARTIMGRAPAVQRDA